MLGAGKLRAQVVSLFEGSLSVTILSETVSSVLLSRFPDADLHFKDINVHRNAGWMMAGTTISHRIIMFADGVQACEMPLAVRENGQRYSDLLKTYMIDHQEKLNDNGQLSLYVVKAFAAFCQHLADSNVPIMPTWAWSRSQGISQGLGNMEISNASIKQLAEDALGLARGLLQHVQATLDESSWLGHIACSSIVNLACQALKPELKLIIKDRTFNNLAETYSCLRRIEECSFWGEVARSSTLERVPMGKIPWCDCMWFEEEANPATPEGNRQLMAYDHCEHTNLRLMQAGSALFVRGGEPPAQEVIVIDCCCPNWISARQQPRYVEFTIKALGAGSKLTGASLDPTTSFNLWHLGPGKDGKYWIGPYWIDAALVQRGGLVCSS